MKINSTKIILTSTLICLNLSSLSAADDSAINIVIPKAPKVNVVIPTATVISVNNSKNEEDDKHKVKLQPKRKITSHAMIEHVGTSKRVPPGYYKKKNIKSFADKDVKAGDIDNSRVPAYLQTTLISKEEVLSGLEKAGFKVLAEYKTDKKGKFISIVFTNDAMTTSASKDKRGFAATLRLLINTRDSQISISNPLYVMKAFMQDDYNDKVAKETLDNLHTVFKDLKKSKEIVKFARLSRYQFMQNMPYYQDMLKVTTGKNETLLQKARKSKKMVFEHKLDNGSTIIGVSLSKRTGKFVKKIGFGNSELLPYPILIENNTAKILDPKYYIAVMYPNLAMSEFMEIATIPGAISKECDIVFR